ncbi:hypothetical protein [Streptomyces sp. NPDC051776]
MTGMRANGVEWGGTGVPVNRSPPMRPPLGAWLLTNENSYWG